MFAGGARMDRGFPLVAVITPVLNGAEYLDEALASVQAQTYPNLVHMVLDNCSQDATPDILARYHNARVPVVVARNDRVLPLCDNWEAAFRRAPPDAKYVRLLCHDDAIRPDCIARTVEMAESDPDIVYVASGIVVGATCDWNATPKALGDWPAQDAVLAGSEVMRRVLLDEMWVISNQITMRRAQLDRHNPLFDAGWGLQIDNEMALRCAVDGKIGLLPEPLAFMRDHVQSETNRARNTQAFFVSTLKYFLRWGPTYLSPEEYARSFNRFRALYVRRMLKWRLTNPRAYEYHSRELKALGQMPSVGEYAGALLEWPISKLRKKNPIYSDLTGPYRV